MKANIQEGYVTPASHRGKKGRTHNHVVELTDYMLHGNIRDFCFHELQQHLPCLTLFLYEFDNDEEKFGEKASVRKMNMYFNVGQQESGRELKKTTTSNLWEARDRNLPQKNRSTGLVLQFHNHVWKQEQERESIKHEASEPADPASRQLERVLVILYLEELELQLELQSQ